MTARTTEEEACPILYLPDDIWECIFKFFDKRTFKSFSIVSKQFLSLTNRLRYSITITDQTIPFLSRLFDRFSNLTSLRLIRPSESNETLLTLISTFPILSNIKSLHLSNGHNNIPVNGLRALSEKMKNLTSFTCYKLNYIRKKDLFFYTDCFPLLEELDLRASKSLYWISADDHRDQPLALPKLRKISLVGNIFFDHQYIVDLCKNCELLQEIIVIDESNTKQTYVLS